MSKRPLNIGQLLTTRKYGNYKAENISQLRQSGLTGAADRYRPQLCRACKGDGQRRAQSSCAFSGLATASELIKHAGAILLSKAPVVLHAPGTSSPDSSWHRGAP